MERTTQTHTHFFCLLFCLGFYLLCCYGLLFTVCPFEFDSKLQLNTLRARLDSTDCVVYWSCVFLQFFFSRVFGGMRLLFMHCCINSNRKCWLFPMNSAFVHCSWTYKFHFLATFSLKMGHTVLFTHLKIILLQWFQQ